MDHDLSIVPRPAEMWRMLPIVGFGLPATQLTSRQSSFRTGAYKTKRPFAASDDIGALEDLPCAGTWSPWSTGAAFVPH